MAGAKHPSHIRKAPRCCICWAGRRCCMLLVLWVLLWVLLPTGECLQIAFSPQQQAHLPQEQQPHTHQGGQAHCRGGRG